MDKLISIVETINRKLILCENGYANTELIALSKLIIEQPQLHQNKELSEVMGKIIKAHEYKNYVYLADLLEYELIPVLEKLSI